MERDSLSSSYSRAALFNQYNIILLAGSVAFSAALASWAPLLSGALGEAVWLIVAPRLQGFRRRADSRRQRGQSARAARELGPDYATHVESLQAHLSAIERLGAARADLSPAQRAEVIRRLPPLWGSFLELCRAHHRVNQATAGPGCAGLQAELASLHQALAAETDLGVRASLRRALAGVERRMRQLESNVAVCRSLEVSLRTLHTSLAYIEERAAASAAASELCAEMESVTAELLRAASLEPEPEAGTAPRISAPPAALN